ncbi:MAG: transcription factor E [Methanosphaera sp. rholeuAM74]|nr:MAG: transcription factor E [Methanosphaera sp. rholeuAM74]
MARKKIVYNFDYDSKFLNEHNVKKLAHNLTHDADNSEKILDCLFTAEVTDEQIAEVTGIKLNFVRKILYKLFDAGVATYTRKKDPETQWFTYYWKYDCRKAAHLIEEEYNKHNQEIQDSLEFEENNMFFVCPNGCRYPFDEATDFQFICPRCDEKLDFKDNASIIDNLKNVESTYIINDD